jgi:ABC-type uncharacterized transport system permease subunit
MLYQAKKRSFAARHTRQTACFTIGLLAGIMTGIVTAIVTVKGKNCDLINEVIAQD